MGVRDFKRMNKSLLLVCFAACAAVATAGLAIKTTAYSDSKCTKALASYSDTTGICDTYGSKTYSNVTKKITRAARTGSVKAIMRSASSCSGNLTVTMYSDATCKTGTQEISAAQVKAQNFACTKDTSNYNNLAANGLTDVYEMSTCSSSGASSVVPAAAAGALALVAMWFA